MYNDGGTVCANMKKKIFCVIRALSHITIIIFVSSLLFCSKNKKTVLIWNRLPDSLGWSLFFQLLQKIQGQIPWNLSLIPKKPK